MIPIGKDEALLQYLTGINSIISGTVHRIVTDLQPMSTSTVGIYIELLYAKTNKHILIRFTDVQVFDFIYDGNLYPYYIERFKLFKTESGFYFSLDPWNEEETIDDRDQDKMRANGMEGFII